MNNNMTAVDSLIKEIENLITIETFQKWMAIKQQAKEMERKQIIDAYDKGEFNDGMNGDAEQYYNEQFKKD